MDKLQWFKFSPSDWMMGKIQRCPEVTQARFIRLCCLYWNKESNLLKEDAIIEIDQEHYNVLVGKKIITDDGTHVIIDFLNEQLEGITELSKSKSKAAKARWDKYNSKQQHSTSNTDAMHVHTSAMQNDAEKRREEEIREEKEKEKKTVTDERFFVFWDKYQKKVDREKCEKKWRQLSEAEKQEALDHVEKYVKATPDKKYRKNPLTYLNGKVWKDEEMPGENNKPERTMEDILTQKFAM